MRLRESARLRQRLRSQLLIRHFDIRDPRILNFIKNNVIDEDFFMEDFTDGIFKLFEFDFVELSIPGEVCEEFTQGYDVQIHGAIFIPGLLPYVNHPLFKELQRQIEVYVNRHGSEYIELYHIPDCLFLEDDNPVFVEFKDQPACFILQGNGYNSGIDMVYEFLKKMMYFNDAICAITEGRDMT